MLKPGPEKVIERWIHNTPLGRLTQAEDIANAALFLASPLSDHITGETITVSGGLKFCGTGLSNNTTGATTARRARHTTHG